MTSQLRAKTTKTKLVAPNTVSGEYLLMYMTLTTMMASTDPETTHLVAIQALTAPWDAKGAMEIAGKLSRTRKNASRNTAPGI